MSLDLPELTEEELLDLDRLGHENDEAALPSEYEKLTEPELIELCSVDGPLFCSIFFPGTTRQSFPIMEKEIWQLLCSTSRYVNIQMARGWAKTSRLRMYTAMLIAYSLSKTIVYIGKSEDHAIRSAAWIKKQVLFNPLYRDVFKLRKGRKWQDTEFEVINDLTGESTWVIALGIHGSVRGVNIDDYRPDTIILDDVVDESNASTEDQRLKTSNLIHGAVKRSLAPETEFPHAKMVMLNTPQNNEDASCRALRDKQFVSLRVGCWTKETENLPLEERKSSWPEVYTDKFLRAEYRSHAAQNNLSLFIREMECRIASPETNAFREEWLQYYTILPERHHFDYVCYAIDPVPPPTDVQIAKGLIGKDFEAHAIVGRSGEKFYLIDYEFSNNHDPDWTIMIFFNFVMKYRPDDVLVESIAFQSVLAWLMKKAMEARKQFVPIGEFKDRRKKFNRIVDGLRPIVGNLKLYVDKSKHVEFIEQYINYPHSVDHDDIIEAVAVATEQCHMGQLVSVGQASEAVTKIGKRGVDNWDYGRDKDTGFQFNAP